jgi:hypothetical protein
VIERGEEENRRDREQPAGEQAPPQSISEDG